MKARKRMKRRQVGRKIKARKADKIRYAKMKARQALN